MAAWPIRRGWHRSSGAPSGRTGTWARVIPGSHLDSEPPIDINHGYGTGMGPHPDEVKIIAPAGSLIMFNAPDLWHSGTFNYSPAPPPGPDRGLWLRTAVAAPSAT